MIADGYMYRLFVGGGFFQGAWLWSGFVECLCGGQQAKKEKKRVYVCYLPKEKAIFGRPENSCNIKDFLFAMKRIIWDPAVVSPI